MDMSRFKISPNFYATEMIDPSINDKIDLYEDRVSGWIFHPARLLNKDEHSGFALLQVLLSYFEGHAVFRRGEDSESKSKEYFSETLLSVFPEVLKFPDGIKSGFIEIMYRDARCGLYHTGMVRRRIVLQDSESTFTLGLDRHDNLNTVHIDRHSFQKRIEEHFLEYLSALRNPANSDLRDKFNTGWEILQSK